MKLRLRACGGLSLVEVLLIIGTLAIMAAVFLPALARQHARPKRISCTSNLKLVGLAYRLFANDHDDRFPYALSNELGGTLSFARSPQVFRHYEAMSNELVTPKILRCPEDRRKVPATDFQTALSNMNISYFVGLDASESVPQTLLSGDRNITGGRLTNGFLRLIAPNDAVGWTKEIHNNAGNVGLGDGSVQQFSPATLTGHTRAQFSTIRLAIP